MWSHLPCELGEACHLLELWFSPFVEMVRRDNSCMNSVSVVWSMIVVSKALATRDGLFYFFLSMWILEERKKTLDTEMNMVVSQKPIHSTVLVSVMPSLFLHSTKSGLTHSGLTPLSFKSPESPCFWPSEIQRACKVGTGFQENVQFHKTMAVMTPLTWAGAMIYAWSVGGHQAAQS